MRPSGLRRLPLLALVAALAACSPAGMSPGAPPPAASPSGTDGASASPSGATSALPTTTPRPSPTPLAYLVRPGDTLTSIATAFGTTPRSIAFWNRLTYPTLDPQSAAYAPNSIAIGWTLRIWPGTEVDEANLPPGPSPSPMPSLVLPAGPTPAPDGTSLVVSDGPRGGNGVALTFDMDGRLDPALDIVDWLIANQVEATVFPTGQAATTDVGRSVLARIGTRPGLFSIGNGTWDGADMTKLPASAVGTELQDTEAAVSSLAGRSTKPFYRPPSGTQDAATRRIAGSLGWAYTVLWDVDTVDWMPISEGGPTADDLVARVLSRARGGSIVLLHLGGYETLAALPRIVAGLRAAGLHPVTLERLLGT